jgi:hypothetical protein
MPINSFNASATQNLPQNKLTTQTPNHQHTNSNTEPTKPQINLHNIKPTPMHRNKIQLQTLSNRTRLHKRKRLHTKKPNHEHSNYPKQA